MPLYDHQEKIITDDKEHTGLFMGTGSGKTLTALLLARGKTLVIAPKTQVEDRNWQREAEENVLDIDLTVMSKEHFRRDSTVIESFDTVIVDEAHTCLGVTPNMRWVKTRLGSKQVPKTSQLFDALYKYLRVNKPQRFYLCTATVLRSPMTVWGAAVLLGHDWDFLEFREAFYFKLPMPGRDAWVPKNDGATKDRLARAVRNIGYTGRLEDYFDVPEQTHKNVYVDVTPEQKKRIKELKLEYPEPIARLGKTHEVENGIIVGNEFIDEEKFGNAKIDKLIDYAYEFPRMIVFARFVPQVHAIAEAIKETGKEVHVMTGQTKDRGKLIESLKGKKDYAFIVSAQISAGWELPECPVVIFASRTYSFVDYDQALGRVQRANSIKKNLYISLIVRGGVDEAVHRCIVEKKDFNERIYLNI